MPQGPIATTLVNNQLQAASRNGTLFQAANSAGVTTSAALATTYVGICLSNPAGNGFCFIVRNVGAMLVVAPAALTGIGLITGWLKTGVTAHTTPLVPYPALPGGLTNPASTTPVASTATVDSACTIVGTPAWTQFLTVTPTATSIPPVFNVDLNGDLVIPPGGYVAIGTTIAGPASGFLGSFQWLEQPI